MSNKIIPYGKQDIDDEDIDAVVSVLKSDYLTQGPVKRKFEIAIANYCGSNYAIAVNSATSALHLTCLAMGLKRGDFLWTSPVTFVASANCALYCGADIDFVDIDAQTNNMCPKKLEEKLIIAEKFGKLPKIVVAVHMGGLSCDMKAIRALSRKYNFKVIEDASHAIGASYLNSYVGSCEYSDATIFSLHPVKIITSGEGGVIVTNDQNLASMVELLSSHGVTRDQSLMDKRSEGEWYYQQIYLGFNYRMTDIHAALGLSQIRKLSNYVSKRNEIAAIYTKSLNPLNIECPKIPNGSMSSFHLYIIKIKHDILGISKSDFFNSMRKSGIGVNVHYIPVHLQPYYSKLGFKLGDFPISEEYYRQAISIPIYPTMTNDQVNKVISTVAAKLA